MNEQKKVHITIFQAPFASLIELGLYTIDTYVYRMGIENADYSFSTAAGMFKSVVAFILIVVVNQIAKKTGNEGLY